MQLTITFDPYDDQQIHTARQIVNKAHYGSNTRRMNKIELIKAIRAGTEVIRKQDKESDTNFPVFPTQLGLKEAKRLADIMWEQL